MFEYEKMVRTAAYVLEYLGQQDDLKTWPYPATETTRLDTPKKNSFENIILLINIFKSHNCNQVLLHSELRFPPHEMKNAFL